jgi:hypothetical protein
MFLELKSQINMLYTIIEKETGKELYATFDISNLQENEIAIEEMRTIEMENPYFNFETREFYNKEIN